MRIWARLSGAATTLLLLLAWAGGAFAQTTLVLQPDPAAGEDTYISFASSVQNYDALDTLISNSQSNGGSHILIRFDLSAVPAGASIVSATLELYYYATRTNLTESLPLYRVTRPWVESAVTWRSNDGAGSWTTPGGDFDPTPVATASLDATVNVWKSWNVASLVQGWVDGSFPNEGMILDPPDAKGNNERSFYSSDFTANPALRPRLTLVFAASDLRASTKAVSAATAARGEILTYTIVVKNAGTVAASGVSVTDTVDTTKLDSIVPGQGGVLSGGTLTWNSATTPALASVGPTPAGDVTLSFTARVLPSLADGTVIANQALLSSASQAGIPSDDPATPALDDATLVTVRVPLASLYKRILEINGVALPDDPSNPPGVSGALTSTAVPGDVITYAVFFVNEGAIPATALVARDGVPQHTDFVADAYGPGRGIRLVYGATLDLTNALDADAGLFDPAAPVNPDDPGTPINGLVTVTVGSLPPGASGSVRFQVRVR